MQNFLRNTILVVILMLISLVVGMISPGMWLGNRRQDVSMLYHKMIGFRNVPLAQNFTTTPFDLRIMYVKSANGALETYLMNQPKNEMLPIYEVEGTTQVGDISHRFKGLGEEGRGKLEKLLESVKEDGTGAIDNLLKLLGN